MKMGDQIKSVRRADYSIDAPGVRRTMLTVGGIGLVLALIGAWIQAFGLAGAVTTSQTADGLMALGLFVASYGLFMGGYMTYGSRVGKLRTRDRLLGEVARLKPWRGNEHVLDVGCGRGLMVIGAAKRLDAGQRGLAIGIDLWRAEDQTDNTPRAAMDNARIEGVADRVRIDTGDALNLPYADGSFDVVLSHWVVHNLEQAEDRKKVLDEMLRVLRPGGVIALADIACFAQYRQHLQTRGVTDVRFLNGAMEARVMGALSAGSFRPQALLAVLPVVNPTAQLTAQVQT